MDDRDEDEKRRVMTPPKEWSGDQTDDASDSDWLNDSESEANEHQEAPEPEKPAVDDSGWLTADDAPPEPDFSPAQSPEPEADWFSENDLAKAPATDDGGPAPEASPSTAKDGVQGPEATRTPRPATAPPTGATPNAHFSSEDLLTDHQVVGTGSAGRLPLWPTLGGAVAVVLLLIGGWGAISERSALQQRIVQLEQQQSAPRSQGDLDAQAEAALAAENQALQMQLSSLRDQYNVANATINTLQAELDQFTSDAPAAPAAEEAALTALSTPPSPTADNATLEAETVAPPDTDIDPPSTSSADPPAGGWFVNVAAYSKSATAESWAERLRGEGFNAITQSVDSGGRTLFRVRAVGFPTEGEARAAAGQLEAEYNIGPLWVGEASSPVSNTPVSNSPVSNSPAESAPAESASATALPGATDSPKATPAAVQPTTATSNSAEPGTGGWFIYVDTYSEGLEADKKAQQIEEAGYAAKVAVEYRSNALFYRVQIVGIDSREQGEGIIEALAAGGDMPNLQLRQY